MRTSCLRELISSSFVRTIKYLRFCQQVSSGTENLSLRRTCAELRLVEFAAQPGLRHCEYDECEWIPVRPEGSSFVPGYGGAPNADGKAHDTAHHGLHPWPGRC